jgi:hypothetical protein
MASASPPENFEKNIKRWVLLDNKIKELNEQLREYRDARKDINDTIFSIVEENKLHGAVIKISDGRLEFKKVKVQQPISLKFLKECLAHFIEDEEQVKTIIDYVKQNRETKMSDDIKRVYASGKGGSGGGSGGGGGGGGDDAGATSDDE